MKRRRPNLKHGEGGCYRVVMHCQRNWVPFMNGVHCYQVSLQQQKMNLDYESGVFCLRKQPSVSHQASWSERVQPGLPHCTHLQGFPHGRSHAGRGELSRPVIDNIFPRTIKWWHSQEPYIVYKGYLFFWDNAKTLQIKTPTFFKTSLKCSDEIKEVRFIKYFLFYEPVDFNSLIRHAPCLKLGGCNGRQLHIYQKDPLIWSAKYSYQEVKNSTGLPQLRNVNLERRGSVTVALTCARTLVFPNVTWWQLMWLLYDYKWSQYFFWNEAAPDKTPNLNQSWLTSPLYPSILCHPICDPPTMPGKWYQHGLTLKLMSFCIWVWVWLPQEGNFSHRMKQVSPSWLTIIWSRYHIKQISHLPRRPFDLVSD